VRLQLLATELQQEKLRLLESLARLVVAAMACCVGLLLFSLFVVLLVEPAHRLLALGVVVGFPGRRGLAWRMARRRQQAVRAFEASLTNCDATARRSALTIRLHPADGLRAPPPAAAAAA
jgi:uncharacterized membrane protein YqjE